MASGHGRRGPRGAQQLTFDGGDLTTDARAQALHAMVPIDVLSGTLICSTGSLVGAAMRRLAVADDDAKRSALHGLGQISLMAAWFRWREPGGLKDATRRRR